MCFGWSRLCHIFWGFDQTQKLRADHFGQHALGQWVGGVVVANVNVQAVHDVVVRVGQEFFHGSVAHFWRHTLRHVGREIRFGREFGDILQGQNLGRLFCCCALRIGRSIFLECTRLSGQGCILSCGL